MILGITAVHHTRSGLALIMILCLQVLADACILMWQWEREDREICDIKIKFVLDGLKELKEMVNEAQSAVDEAQANKEKKS